MKNIDISTIIKDQIHMRFGLKIDMLFLFPRLTELGIFLFYLVIQRTNSAFQPIKAQKLVQNENMMLLS